MSNTEMDKKHEKNRTKDGIYCRITEYIDEGQDILHIESNKRKISLSINEGVLRKIEELYPDRSKLVQELLVDLLEKKLGKKIVIERYVDNYKREWYTPEDESQFSK